MYMYTTYITFYGIVGEVNFQCQIDNIQVDEY
jgi:hypothetical protein